MLLRPVHMYFDDANPHLVFTNMDDNRVDIAVDQEDFILQTSYMYRGDFMYPTGGQDRADYPGYRRVVHSLQAKFHVNEFISLDITLSLSCENTNDSEAFHKDMLCPYTQFDSDGFSYLTRKIHVLPHFRVEDNVAFNLYPHYSDRSSSVSYFYPRNARLFGIYLKTMPNFIQSLSDPNKYNWDAGMMGMGSGLERTITTSIMNSQDIPYEIAREESKMIARRVKEKVS